MGVGVLVGGGLGLFSGVGVRVPLGTTSTFFFVFKSSKNMSEFADLVSY